MESLSLRELDTRDIEVLKCNMSKSNRLKIENCKDAPAVNYKLPHVDSKIEICIAILKRLINSDESLQLDL